MSQIIKKTFADLRGGLNTVLDRVQLETQEGPLSTPDCLNVLGRSGGIETRSGTDTYADLGAAYRLYTVVAIMPWNPIGGGLIKPPIDGGLKDPPPIWVDLEPIDPDDTILPPIYIIITPPPPPVPLCPGVFALISPAENSTIYLGTGGSAQVSLIWQASANADHYGWAVGSPSLFSAADLVASGYTGNTSVSVTLPAGHYEWSVVAYPPAGSACSPVFATGTSAGVGLDFDVVDNRCPNCTGGPGVTPLAFNVSIPGLGTLTNYFGEESGHVDHIFSISGGSALQTSACVWAGIIGELTVNSYNGLGALVDTTIYEITATIQRTIISTYILDIDAGGAELFHGEVTSDGCVAATIGLADEYGFQEFTSLSATITP